MWVLRKYGKSDERLLGEEPLMNVGADMLRRLWNEPDDNPMYDAYPVTEEQATALRGRVEDDVALDEYDYFVEYFAQ
jgi:hypothetical protein